ncbi:MAG TPA: hypothetical protein PKA82_11485 [Pyrinomonadaceae bacterium]|nr:hypothetical protein [Pyrinomonadaceae bacterium]
MADSTSKDYFLGGLSEAEVAEFELRIFEDANFAEEVSISEENLIEAYLGEELTPEDEVRFETNYLVTDERIKSVEMIAQLHRIASERKDGMSAESGVSFGETGVLYWIRSLSLGLRLAAAGVVFILMFTSIWLVFRPSNDDALVALQVRYEKINQDQNFLDSYTNISELTLLSDNLRSTASPAELSHVGLTKEVRIRLALGETADNTTIYNVTVFRGLTVAFRQNRIAPFARSAVQEIRLILPREIFTKGKYIINLTDEKGSTLNYQFVVQ